MNDTELDEMLGTWTAPPVPASLRRSVRAGFAAGRKPKTSPGALVRWRKRLIAGAVLGAVAFVFIATQALPQMSPARIPYTVDSEFIRYADDGSSSIEMYSTSYGIDGREFLLSRSIPGRPFGTAIGRTLDATLPLWSRLMSRLTIDAGTLEKVGQAAAQTVGVISGCDASCLVLQHLR